MAADFRKVAAVADFREAVDFGSHGGRAEAVAACSFVCCHRAVGVAAADRTTRDLEEGGDHNVNGLHASPSARAVYTTAGRTPCTTKWSLHHRQVPQVKCMGAEGVGGPVIARTNVMLRVVSRGIAEHVGSMVTR